MNGSSKTKKNKKRLLEALERAKGIVTAACKATNISRRTHYCWIHSDEEYRQEYEHIKDMVLDFVESKLLKKIDEEDTTAIIFYLKTQGKNRGYVERDFPNEIINIGDINVQIVMPASDTDANKNNKSILLPK